MAKDKANPPAAHDRPPTIETPKPGEPVKAGETAERPQSETATDRPQDATVPGGTGEGSASGQPDVKAAQEKGGPTQPIRPDATTQQPRPNVGGGRPEEAFPDRPDQGGEGKTAGQLLAERTAEEEEKAIDEVEERAGGSGVFRITGSVSGMPEPPAIVAGSDFPTGTDLRRLVRLKAIEPIRGMEADPEMSRIMQRNPRVADEVESLHGEVTRLKEENDRLRKDNANLRKDVAEARRGG